MGWKAKAGITAGVVLSLVAAFEAGRLSIAPEPDVSNGHWTMTRSGLKWDFVDSSQPKDVAVMRSLLGLNPKPDSTASAGALFAPSIIPTPP